MIPIDLETLRHMIVITVLCVIFFQYLKGDGRSSYLEAIIMIQVIVGAVGLLTNGGWFILTCIAIWNCFYFPTINHVKKQITKWYSHLTPISFVFILNSVVNSKLPATREKNKFYRNWRDATHQERSVVIDILMDKIQNHLVNDTTDHNLMVMSGRVEIIQLPIELQQLINRTLLAQHQAA